MEKGAASAVANTEQAYARAADSMQVNALRASTDAQATLAGAAMSVQEASIRSGHTFAQVSKSLARSKTALGQARTENESLQTKQKEAADESRAAGQVARFGPTLISHFSIETEPPGLL